MKLLKELLKAAKIKLSLGLIHLKISLLKRKLKTVAKLK